MSAWCDASERLLELVVAVAGLAGPALLARHHGVVRLRVGVLDPLRAPVRRVIGLPRVAAPAGEPGGRQAHDLERAIAGQDDEVGPRQRVAVLLLDRGDQSARLVDVAVVPPRA